MSSTIGKPNVSKPASAGGKAKAAGEKKASGPPEDIVKEAKALEGKTAKIAEALTKAFASPDENAMWCAAASSTSETSRSERSAVSEGRSRGGPF